LMNQAAFHELIGDENIQPTLTGAVSRAREILGTPHPVTKVA
jgi:hypothetical protein